MADQPVSHPLPQFLTSAPSNTTTVHSIADAIAAPASGMQLSIFKDENDTFHFHPLAESADLLKRSREGKGKAMDAEEWQPKHIILCFGTIPDLNQTPLFNLGLYYEHLSKAHKQQQARGVTNSWRLGETLLYGEVVTSTQIMLTKSVDNFF